MSLTFPTVHLNGTSGEELIRQHRKAFDAIDKAIDALCEATPHGRDYYVKASDSFNPLTLAQAEHRSRLQRLRDVQEELGKIMIAVREQMDARSRR